MSNKKTGLYLLITFIITYGSWFTVSFMLGQESLNGPLFIIYILGGFGPTISAFIIKLFWGDKIEFKNFVKQIIQVKVNVGWYVFILVAPLVQTFFPYFINSIITGKQQLLVLQPVYMLLAMIPVMIIGGGLEELGWRGVLLPELLKKQSVLVSTIIVSIIWSIWHIPLWFIKGVSQYGSNFVEFAFAIIGFSMLLSIIYIKTESIFMCILFHSLSNSYYAVFSTPCSDTLSVIINISSKLIICIVTFIVFLMMTKKKTIKNNLEIT